jgi:hypothetical protein
LHNRGGLAHAAGLFRLLKIRSGQEVLLVV